MVPSCLDCFLRGIASTFPKLKTDPILSNIGGAFCNRGKGLYQLIETKRISKLRNAMSSAAYSVSPSA